MTSTLLALAAGLGWVVGLFLIVSRLVRGSLRGDAALRDGRVEVLSRTSIGPRQGVAMLEVEDRRMLVSFGEGGVRFLVDVPTAAAAPEPRPEQTVAASRSPVRAAAGGGYAPAPGFAGTDGFDAGHALESDTGFERRTTVDGVPLPPGRPSVSDGDAASGPDSGSDAAVAGTTSPAEVAPGPALEPSPVVAGTASSTGIDEDTHAAAFTGAAMVPAPRHSGQAIAPEDHLLSHIGSREAERRRLMHESWSATGPDWTRDLLDRVRRRIARLPISMRNWMVGLVLALAVGAAPASAQTPAPTPADSSDVQATIAQQGLPQIAQPLGGIVFGEEDEGIQLSGPVGAVVFVGVMTLIPTLLLLTTSFTRIFIVLHLLKQALGTQTAPPAHLLAAMSVMLTGFVMAPTFEEINRSALGPWMAGEMDELQVMETAAVPMREFMLRSTREADLETFVSMRDGPLPETIDDVPFVVLTSAFVTSELTTAFQMGFALFLPFVVIDLVVASVLMSMGMFMLPPVMVSLPFKLLLFVLVDGWALIMGSIVSSF